MITLSLHLLGPFQASLDGEPLTDFRTRKVQALLIYLATETQGHKRDRLLDLFWPGLPERSARSNLRQIIYYLRQLLPEPPGNGQPLLIVNRQEIQLNPQAEVTVDVAQFQALLDQSQAHDHLDLFLCADCCRCLEQAVDLYRGDLLPDDPYSDWLSPQYQACVDALAAELDTPPSPETAALYEQLLRGELPPLPRPPIPV
jgi:DNA-binding SARP family transcriptional activator